MLFFIFNMPSIGKAPVSKTIKRKVAKKIKLNYNFKSAKVTSLIPKTYHISNVNQLTSSPNPNFSLSYQITSVNITSETCKFKPHDAPAESPPRHSSPPSLHYKPYNLNIDQLLSTWAIRNNVKGTAITSLLKLLKQHQCFNTLPSDYRTLLKTPRATNCQSIHPGKYCHFQLKQIIESILTCSGSDVRVINIQLNIDGLPISKSSSQQFWPILGYFPDFPTLNPFVIGIYFGEDKPSSSNLFLKKLVDDILGCDTVDLGGEKVKIKIQVHSFVCDAPARAFILNVKGHTGYFGRQKCNAEGDYISHRISFPTKVLNLRTDADFRSKTNEEYHTGRDSELLRLPIDIVNQFPLDYQHLICLGVVRKIVNLWVSGKIKTCRLSAASVLQLSRSLIELKQFIPSEFPRRPRSLSHLKNWKANEFRTFLLYTGPVVLKNILPAEYYNHFIALHVAISILISKKYQPKYIDYAENLLQYFVTCFPKLYGAEKISYNVHNLLHLAGDCRKFGVLDNFSTFKFENHLGKIKKLIRSGNRPLEQAYNRISEQQKTNLLASGLQQQKSLLKKEFNITSAVRDSGCVLSCGSIFQVEEIYLDKNNEYKIVGCALCGLDVVYNIPCKSSLIGVKKFSYKSDQRVISSSDIVSKL